MEEESPLSETACGPVTQSPSMTDHERVLDLYARDRLPCVEIFREDPSGTAPESRCDNKGIPETDARLIFDSKCRRNFSSRGIHAPDGVAAHDKTADSLDIGRDIFRVTFT